MDFYSNGTDLSQTNISNYTDNSSYSGSSIAFISLVVIYISISAGLPLILVAIVALYHLVRKGHVAPVYIINLLVSDLIQLCCLTALRAGQTHEIIYVFYYHGVLASVGFMVCVSLERYLVIAWPLWYRFRRNIRTCLAVCGLVWTLPLVYILPAYFDVDFQLCETVYAIYLLLPFPFLIFFLVGTFNALSAAQSVPADEKRKIMAIVVILLLSYTLFFFPSVIWSLVEKARTNVIFDGIAFILLYLSPVADLTLYFFLRRGVVDKLLKSVCCCKMSSNKQTSSTINENTSASCDQAV